jgi:hypothetical protein
MKEKREVYCCFLECMFLFCSIIHYGHNNDNNDNNDINDNNDTTTMYDRMKRNYKKKKGKYIFL